MEIKDKFPVENVRVLIEDQILYHKLWLEICEVSTVNLFLFNNKRITKRMLSPWQLWCDNMKQNHPEYEIEYVTYTHEYGTFRINIWFSIFRDLKYNKYNYKNRDQISLDVGRQRYNETGPVFFNFEQFEVSHECCFNKLEHTKTILKLQKALESIEEIAKEYNYISDMNKRFWDNLEDKYTIRDYQIIF